MITIKDFYKLIEYKEQQNEIQAISKPVQTIAWQKFVQTRDTDDFIASSDSEDAIYDRELEIAEEIINDIARASK